MVLKVDFSRSLRTSDQLAGLVRAVVAAGPSDESRAVEWKKGYLDLTAPEASYAIARAVLGFANRMPGVAATQFEGAAYVVVGAEPGALLGQEVPDSAEVVNAIGRYCGQGFPLWDGRTVSVEGKRVYVVTVEPPRAGDRFALLQRDFQPAKGGLVKAGTVFVRQPGATERATKQEMESLQDRLLDGSRHDTHRSEIRTVIDSVIGSARKWAVAMQAMLLQTALTGRAWTRREVIEWLDTDSGVEQRQQMQLFTESVRRTRLLTTQPGILTAITALVHFVQEDRAGWNLLNGDVPLTEENRGKAAAQLIGAREAADELERAAITLLAR